MLTDYSAFLHLRLLPPSTPPNHRPTRDTDQENVIVTRRLLACVERLLRARGVKGVHTAVHCSQADTIRLYMNLGFEDQRKRKKGRRSRSVEEEEEKEIPHGENVVLLCKTLQAKTDGLL